MCLCEWNFWLFSQSCSFLRLFQASKVLLKHVISRPDPLQSHIKGTLSPLLLLCSDEEWGLLFFLFWFVSFLLKCLLRWRFLRVFSLRYGSIAWASRAILFFPLAFTDDSVDKCFVPCELELGLHLSHWESSHMFHCGNFSLDLSTCLIHLIVITVRSGGHR